MALHNNLRGIYYFALRLGLVEADVGFQRGFPLAQYVYIYKRACLFCVEWQRAPAAEGCPVFALHLPCAGLQGLARLEKAGKNPPASAGFGAQLSPVPARKPLCCLGSSIKPPFYETFSGMARNGRKHPKIRVINPFR